MNYWLLKSDPATYSWDDLLKDGNICWDGVRNYQARNNLKLMKKGDITLFYHSVKEPAIIGAAKVSKEFYPDPTAPGETWVAIDIIPVKTFKKNVSLQEIKQTKTLKDLALIKQARLSVMQITKKEYDIILSMST